MSAVDLLPTFLEVAGVPLPDDFQPDGQSVLPAFRGEGFDRTKPIFWEWRGPKVREFTWPQLGVRDGRWKLIANDEMQRTELFDLEGDWAEARDVSAEHPEVVLALSAMLDVWKETLPVEPGKSTVSKKRK